MGNWIRSLRPSPKPIDRDPATGSDYSFLSDLEPPLSISRELLLLAARGELTLRVGMGSREEEDSLPPEIEDRGQS